MMLDTATLRVDLAVVDLTLLLLFYFITFRRTRSAYSGWWCLALLMFLSGNAAYLLDGTPHQIWSNPLGNVLLVAGAASIWAGARSLRTTVPKIWYLAAGPGTTAVASVLDQPATNVWSGGPAYLGFMGLLIGLGLLQLGSANSGNALWFVLVGWWILDAARHRRDGRTVHAGAARSARHHQAGRGSHGRTH